MHVSALSLQSMNLGEKAIWFSYWTLDYLVIMEWVEIWIYSLNKETPYSEKCLDVI